MNLHQRIGIDAKKDLPVEEAIVWAAEHDVHFLDVEVDLAPNALETIAERAPRIRELSARHGVNLGLHTVSGVNIAEVSPFVRDAADQYLRTYADMAVDTGAQWVVVHAGYHFTGDYALRREAALERLGRAAEYAERVGTLLLLENTNREPDDAEVHYLASSIEECRYYLDNLRSPALGFSFTVNHAHLFPEGIRGFVEALDLTRCREVRLADCRGTVEEHLHPGEGTIDFGEMFRLVEGAGFTGHYMNQWGTLEDMLEGRRYLVERAREAGIT
ncbi:sugar phosphate isomerase/epimerase family protein [Spiribacter halobius]|uniref:Sugar phosphate isomerase/epimerase n=1 Tax=Sediminicurvatus halobius TaxID=2182432 RepID=A0A2U2N0F8_9GAMM|nr:sugar phosphate isomerase/epimerase family protein [Spiribacter halobius]PWG62725.1 sugar phosphate isomerase/epimerase [Spiribacter halobius]UEX77394.1 sugar phosphate isomerase/epimerase [Spiribacter halobius]